jgi:hypothetical protein
MSSLGAWEWTREGEEDSVGASVVWSSFLAIIRSKQDFNVAISRSLPIKPMDLISNLLIVSSDKNWLFAFTAEDRFISFNSADLHELRKEVVAEDIEDTDDSLLEAISVDSRSSSKLWRGTKVASVAESFAIDLTSDILWFPTLVVDVVMTAIVAPVVEKHIRNVIRFGNAKQILK